MISGSLALAFAAALGGAGLYVNLVEQPAGLALVVSAMLNDWTPCDRRGVSLMAALALLFVNFLAQRHFRAKYPARWGGEEGGEMKVPSS